MKNQLVKNRQERIQKMRKRHQHPLKNLSLLETSDESLTYSLKGRKFETRHLVSYFFIKRQLTSVPTCSPKTTRFKLWARNKSKTMIGILLSMHNENAVESITLSCFCKASR